VAHASTESDVVMSGTAGSIPIFLEVKMRKHELPESVGSPLLTATRRMLDAAEEIGSVPLEELDLESVLTRFRNKNRADLTDQSIRAYESRFKRAISIYQKWRAGDSSWNASKVRSPYRNAGPSQGRNVGRNASAPTNTGNVVVPQPAGLIFGRTNDKTDELKILEETQNAGNDGQSSQVKMFDYVIEFESGKTAILRLPSRYTTEDAKRMTALIDALAFKTPISDDSV
jgi:hypothetical protein